MRKDQYSLHLNAVALVFICHCMGRGVFARGKIPAGVGVCLYAARHISDREQRKLMKDGCIEHSVYFLVDNIGDDSSFSDPYPSVWKLFNKEDWLPVCYGCMLNHRCKGANCTFEWSDVLDCYVLVTNQEIPPGKELTVNYGYKFKDCKCADCSEGGGRCCDLWEVHTWMLPKITQNAPTPWVVPVLDTLREDDANLKLLRGYLEKFATLEGCDEEIADDSVMPAKVNNEQ